MILRDTILWGNARLGPAFPTVRDSFLKSFITNIPGAIPSVLFFNVLSAIIIFYLKIECYDNFFENSR